MRKILLIYSATITLLLVGGVILLRHTFGEVARLKSNQEVLSSEAKLYRTRYNEAALSVEALRLKVAEFREMRARDAERIRQLGIKLRRVESSARIATQSEVQLATHLRDTIYLRDTLAILCDTVSLFSWSDSWVKVEGAIRGDDVHCRVECIDTLHQVVHRVPRRFLFFRYGTKAIRQEIVSSNPHTKIVYAEYIDLRRPRRGRR